MLQGRCSHQPRHDNVNFRVVRLLNRIFFFDRQDVIDDFVHEANDAFFDLERLYTKAVSDFAACARFFGEDEKIDCADFFGIFGELKKLCHLMIKANVPKKNKNTKTSTTDSFFLGG